MSNITVKFSHAARNGEWPQYTASENKFLHVSKINVAPKFQGNQLLIFYAQFKPASFEYILCCCREPCVCMQNKYKMKKVNK